MKILVLSDSHGCRDRLRAIVEAYAPVVDAEGAVEPEDGGTIEPENKEA